MLTLTNALHEYIRFSSDQAIVCAGDSLEILRQFPDNSIDLIIADPPYHVTKKANITGDRSFSTDEQYLIWISDYLKQYKRILKRNGTLYVFSSPKMSGHIELEVVRAEFIAIGSIVWTKPGRQSWNGQIRRSVRRHWFTQSERIHMFEHAVTDDIRTTTQLGSHIRKNRIAAGMSCKTLTGIIGAYRNVNGGGAVSNWEAAVNIPSPDQYKKLTTALEATGKIPPMLEYQNIVRPFNIQHADLRSITDIWEFQTPPPSPNRHPAEKPTDLLQHIIQSSTYPNTNATVLDNFSGSGSTGEAALKTGRLPILIDIEEKWVETTINRIVTTTSPDAAPHTRGTSNETKNHQPTQPAPRLP
jgi:adenine-specific DNA-methyltransferase